MVVACNGEDTNTQQNCVQNWQQRTLSSRSSSQSKDYSHHYHCDSTNHMEAFINSCLKSRDSLQWVLMPSDGVYDSPPKEITRYLTNALRRCFKKMFQLSASNTTCYIIPNALHQIASTVSTVCVSFCRNHFGLQHSGKCAVLPGGPFVSPLLPLIIQLLMGRRNHKKLITWDNMK